MREYVRTKNLHEGDVTRETLYDDKMRVLLRSGNKLTKRAIDMISKLGYKGIYIDNQENCRREDIPLSEPFLDNKTMLRMVAEAKEMRARVLTDGSQIAEFVRVLT